MTETRRSRSGRSRRSSIAIEATRERRLAKLAAITRDERIAAYAAALGVERPSVEEIRDLLALAGVAHASERTAIAFAATAAQVSHRH